MGSEGCIRERFKGIRAAIRATGCTKAVLVGHNAHFDLGFLNAAVARTGLKRNPFHPFSAFDTATLGGGAYGQTVLKRAPLAAGPGYAQPARQPDRLAPALAHHRPPPHRPGPRTPSRPKPPGPLIQPPAGLCRRCNSPPPICGTRTTIW